MMFILDAQPYKWCNSDNSIVKWLSCTVKPLLSWSWTPPQASGINSSDSSSSSVTSDDGNTCQWVAPVSLNEHTIIACLLQVRNRLSVFDLVSLNQPGV